MDHPLIELFRHNLWANEKLLAACEKLDEAQMGASVPGVYGTIRDTLDRVSEVGDLMAPMLTDTQHLPTFE